MPPPVRCGRWLICSHFQAAIRCSVDAVRLLLALTGILTLKRIFNGLHRKLTTQWEECHGCI